MKFTITVVGILIGLGSVHLRKYWMQASWWQNPLTSGKEYRSTFSSIHLDELERCEVHFSLYLVSFFISDNVHIVLRGRPFSTYAKLRTRTCAFQWVRNVSFSENFTYALNQWPLSMQQLPEIIEQKRVLSLFQTWKFFQGAMPWLWSARIRQYLQWILSSCCYFSTTTNLRKHQNDGSEVGLVSLILTSLNRIDFKTQSFKECFLKMVFSKRWNIQVQLL